MEFILSYKLYLLPLTFILLGFLCALLFSKIIIKRLKILAKKTDWVGDDIFLKIISRYMSIWLVLGGIFLAFDTDAFPNSISEPITQILTVIIILTGSLAFANILVSILNIYTSKINGEFQNTGLFNYLIKGVVIGIGIMMILQTFGVSITPLLGALGVGSMAAGFALKDTLANLFAGLQILMTKQLHTGDFIQLSSGMEGNITDITLRNTTLIDRQNNTIVVPNSELAIATVVNFSIPNNNLKVKVDCGVAYDSDLEKVESIALEVSVDVVNNVKGGNPDFAPVIRFHTFNNSSIDFTAVMQATDYNSQYIVKHEFVKRLKKRFDEEGIEIPFPIRTIIQGK
ncbi:MAG: mechanosensitive ion channel family protein [Candidatus Marinimicrobia bacterium]|nr:mechanosensitive ion channel family protein [Candidatus Neomarinimicrobiota bacterium]MBL7023504.1 mechanosensitive ion channel family protein [Candidatus Neomarinimicrobiota bacterium]MBL7109537.1 mechanosensitive ion channel family protein [Candidatus Neomarinimicrobiota bacterium]